MQSFFHIFPACSAAGGSGGEMSASLIVELPASRTQPAAGSKCRGLPSCESVVTSKYADNQQSPSFSRQDMGHWGLAVACWGEQQQADSSRGCQNPAPGSNARVGQSSTFQGSVEYSTTQPVLIWPAEYSAPTAARLAETGIDSSASSSANPICCLVGCSGSSAAAIDKPRASSTSANQSPTTSSIPPGRRSASVCSPGEILCHSSRNVRRPVPHSHQSEPSSTCSTRPISLVVCLHAQHEVFDDLHKKGGALQGHVR